MPWGNRQHPSDSGFRTTWGQRTCPRCGQWVTKNSWGFRSHLKACLAKEYIDETGKVWPAATKEYIEEQYPSRKKKT